jgi:hypothetical protein
MRPPKYRAASSPHTPRNFEIWYYVDRCFFRCETLPCRQTSPLRAACKPSFRPGGTPSDDETVTSVRASRRRTFAQAAAQRFVASISQESVPGPSRHALRHHRLRRCAARPAALTGWALLAGMPRSAVAAVWWPAQAGHQRRTGERTRFALIRPTYRSQISELALCSFFSFRCAGQGAFRRRKVLREGGRAENDCRYVQQV